jgi:hypothetical protein
MKFKCLGENFVAKRVGDATCPKATGFLNFSDLDRNSLHRFTQFTSFIVAVIQLEMPVNLQKLEQHLATRSYLEG